MSTLLSVVGFAAQFCVIAFLGAIVISSVCLRTEDSFLVSEDRPTGAVVSVDDNNSDATLSSARACAKPIISASYTTAIDEPVVFTYDYSAMTVVTLKALCKSRGVKRYSNLRKHELVELLQD